MTIQTRVSEKGQVVIPKEVRDRARILAGDRLDVIERPDGVLLRKPVRLQAGDFDEITARIRSRVAYAGPAVSVEEMGVAVADMWARGGPSWDR